jgi:hypothetical protein
MIESANTIQKTSFSCTVGPDYGKDFSLVHHKVYRIQGFQFSKTEMKVFYLKNRIGEMLSHVLSSDESPRPNQDRRQ